MFLGSVTLPTEGDGAPALPNVSETPRYARLT